MGTIIKAPERVQEEYQGGFSSVADEPPPASATPPLTAAPAPRGTPPPPGLNSVLGAKEPYGHLKASLLTRHSIGSLKTILFAGTSHGDGCSTTAVNFAATLAKDCSLEVLLVDVNPRTPTLHEMFNINEAEGVSDLLTGNRKTACKMKRVGPGNCYVLPWGRNDFEGICPFESSRFDRILKRMREKFDYVILDAPPVPAFPESLLLCAKVDGVVLVVESGKTRRQVALRARKQVEEAGGKVLGVVLNKRRYYIPEWIYRRL